MSRINHGTSALNSQAHLEARRDSVPPLARVGLKGAKPGQLNRTAHSDVTDKPRKK
jgi:hypothetical protein